MRERAAESSLKLWLLMHVNRPFLAGLLTAGVFVGFVIAGAVLPPPFAQRVASGTVIETLFSTMMLIVVTGSTLVVTIGQLVLTQENGPLGDQHERMRNAMNVRGYTEELIGAPTPGDPAAFLGEILAATAQQSEALQASVDDADDLALREDVDALADQVTENANTVREQLDGATFGSFGVLAAALNFDYSWKILEVERIANDYEESLADAEFDLLHDLETALSMFGPAREHVKTLYFQWALIDLSQWILYTAVPALAVGGVFVAVVDGGTFPGSTFGLNHALLAVGGAFAVTLLPFMLFVSYLLRILTVAKRTLAIDPLILRQSEERAP